MTKKNILFIMFDQLRFDYLSCYGHKTLHTPHIDGLAAKGVRFTNAYVQSPVCGASRMSTYTGRYVSSHGASWNNVPLKVGELTLGDHLREAGMGCWLVGKTHMQADAAGMKRLGLAADSVIGARVSEAGFDVWTRDDGLWAEGPGGVYDNRRSPYNAYLKSQGYEGVNPWAAHANAGVDAQGNLASGWFMTHADKPANIDETHSETPWLTGEAIRFMEAQQDRPWLCHVSYIKPHWPYIVPAPYHDMYGRGDIQPAQRHASERDAPHPVFEAFMDTQIGRAFQRDEVREKVIPAYMGLIKQCDDQMGRLFSYLETSGQADNTIIVITSDHGDYLGDHWLGEKDLFHDPSVKVPLIIYDPSPEADATRGLVSDALVEAIDITATCVDYANDKVPDHILEGQTLRPILYGDATETEREFVISEYDYSMHSTAAKLGVAPKDARLFMVADHRWKFMQAEGGMRPMLFDRDADPDEVCDLGADPTYVDVINQMYEHLAQWSRRMSQRTTISDAEIKARSKGGGKGVLIGVYDPEDVAPKDAAFYQGPAPKTPKQ